MKTQASELLSCGFIFGVSVQMLAEDAEAGAEDEKEVEELKKQGINPLPKPPPGVGLLPTPPRPVSMDANMGVGDFGGPVVDTFGGPPGSSQVPLAGKGPPVPPPVPGPNVPVGPVHSPDGSPFPGGPPTNPGCPSPHMVPPPAGGSGASAGKKIPSLFEIKVQPTGQLAQKLAVRYETRDASGKKLRLACLKGQ